MKLTGGAIFATATLTLMAGVGSLAIATDQAHDPAAPDWTVARCTAAHVPAYTRTDMCVNAAGELVSLPLTPSTVPLHTDK